MSGGEEGALYGPALMPGGALDAWQYVRPIFEAISAKTPNGERCCAYIGTDGSGHFVKMVHNGIEYGDMQIICEAYQIMRDMLGMSANEIGEVFSQWNCGELKSYLIEITADILKKNDKYGEPIIDKILDVAGQKGTGKWTGISALEEGIPLTLIGEAVFARCLSAQKDQRIIASKQFPLSRHIITKEKEKVLCDLRNAVYASKIISYAQGFALIGQACKTYGWEIDCGQVALIWREGCIIRSSFLEKIKEAYVQQAKLDNLLMAPYFSKCIIEAQEGWRNTVARSVMHSIPLPAISSALSYFDGYRCNRSPVNLLQAQRDYFGAHTYERTDCPRGEFFHTDWTGRGGDTSASTYSV